MRFFLILIFFVLQNNLISLREHGVVNFPTFVNTVLLLVLVVVEWTPQVV